MPSSLLPALLLQLILVGFTPGPGNIFALAVSLRFDRKTSLKVWLGLLTGASIASCSLAVAIHYAGLALGDYVAYLKYGGALYILYLAYKIGIRPNEKGKNKEYKCSFFTGMLIQLTNAKMLLFDLTIFSTFVLPYSNRIIDLLIAAAWLLIAGPGANLTWSLVGSYLKSFFMKYQRKVDMCCACALVVCAILIVI